MFVLHVFFFFFFFFLLLLLLFFFVFFFFFFLFFFLSIHSIFKDCCLLMYLQFAIHALVVDLKEVVLIFLSHVWITMKDLQGGPQSKVI